MRRSSNVWAFGLALMRRSSTPRFNIRLAPPPGLSLTRGYQSRTPFAPVEAALIGDLAGLDQPGPRHVGPVPQLGEDRVGDGRLLRPKRRPGHVACAHLHKRPRHQGYKAEAKDQLMVCQRS